MSKIINRLSKGRRRMAQHPTLMRLRHRARLWREEHLDWQLVQLRRAQALISLGKADVLALGESSFLFVSPADRDKRKLPAVVRDELGGDVSLTTLSGGGYDPRLYCDFIRLLSRSRRRPRVVLLSVCLRSSMSSHVQLNPRFSYQRSRRVMAGLTSPRPPLHALLVRQRNAVPKDQFEDALVETRWDEPRTIGDFRKQLRGSGTSRNDDIERRLFNYFHGEIVSEDSPGLTKWAELGRLLCAFGVPVVAYHASLPLRRGEFHFPGQFIDHIRANETLVRATLAAELGPLLHMVPIPVLEDSDFVDAGDATEHLAEAGRRAVAKAVADEIRAVLLETSGRGMRDDRDGHGSS